jgi:two-component system cell cycle response regulator DivK
VVDAWRRSILVIDDQEDERAIQRAMLEHLGYGVHDAPDAETGLRLAREVSPDLILLDIALPHVDGFEFYDRLRADSRTAGIPVLFFTAVVATEALQARVADAGAVGLLPKPLDPHEVARIIGGLIGNRQ